MTALPSFADLNRAFLHYLDSFPVDDAGIRDHFQIKKKHTYRVVREIKSIAVQSRLSGRETELARIIALFHDIGRFEQFMRYRTFNDAISENHAEIAVRVLKEQHFLSAIEESTMKIITAAIENHNIPVLPEISDPGILLFSRLLRDADKLDIWKLTLDQNVAFTIRNEKEPDEYRIPEVILSRLREGRVVLLQFAESMNDFRLLRLSWIFDMNFPATFSILEKEGTIDKILARIPEFPEKNEISAILHKYCRNRIQP
ncbi:MAG: metal-dependent phosphohydrolase [Bacteroidetes bacterium]|nr:metal-dependent phosphohydrolase [Bacteroidota bacterium]